MRLPTPDLGPQAGPAAVLHQTVPAAVLHQTVPAAVLRQAEHEDDQQQHGDTAPAPIRDHNPVRVPVTIGICKLCRRVYTPEVGDMV